MDDAKTGVATNINEIGSHVHLTHFHGHALKLVVGDTNTCNESIVIRNGKIVWKVVWIE